MKKQGVSEVVGTILIILIVIAAVSIIWVVIAPMIINNLPSDDERIDLTIDTSGGYTFWDEVNKTACVQVRRWSDGGVLIGIRVIFSVNGNSVNGSFNKTNLPGPNEAKTECFGPFSSKPESVKVIPVFKNREGDATSVVSNIPDGTRGGDGGGTSPISGDDIELMGCGILNQTGKTYLLMKDISGISGNCFIIEADGITLDLNGHSIIGDSSPGAGIYVDGYNQITIKNGKISYFGDLGDGSGVWLKNNQDNHIIGMTLNSNIENGILLMDSSYNTLINNTSSLNNHHGIHLDNSDNNLLQDNILADNYWNGIDLGSGSDNNIIIGNDINLNNNDGIHLYSSLNNNLIDNNISSNLNIGIYIGLNSNSNNLTNNMLSLNEKGIFLESSSYNILISNNASLNGISSGGYGIYLISSSDNILTNNIANLNEGSTGGYGIYLISSSDNEINENTACGNYDWDFYCDSSISNFGGGNNFTLVDACGDGWPINPTNYGDCP